LLEPIREKAFGREVEGRVRQRQLEMSSRVAGPAGEKRFHELRRHRDELEPLGLDGFDRAQLAISSLETIVA
jgi:hypothetical protein